MTPLFSIDKVGGLPLQHQVRRGMIDLMLSGAWMAGDRLPSSREMARSLGVSRNTVVLAYQQLIADGHVVSRERSGLFVAADLAAGPPGFGGVTGALAGGDGAASCWTSRLQDASAPVGRTVPQWHLYP